MKCSKCGLLAADLEPDERLVADDADGTIFCVDCADALSRIVWNAPAIIHHN